MGSDAGGGASSTETGSTLVPTLVGGKTLPLSPLVAGSLGDFSRRGREAAS